MRRTPICLLLLVIIITCTQCVMVGNQWIHSPKAEGGTEIRSRHVHGGVTKKSPPNIVGLTVKDQPDILIGVSAKILTQKNKWVGVGIPIFPIFFLPRINYYEDNPNELIVYVTISAQAEVLIYPEAMTMIVEDKSFTPIKSSFRKKTASPFKILPNESFSLFEAPEVSLNRVIRLTYPVPAHDTDYFQLIPNGIFVGDQKLELPRVEFVKAKQRWIFVGP